MPTPIIISIEGNIGSGKSTLVDELKKLYQNVEEFIFLPEPVDLWLTVKDVDGKNIIEKYYDDKIKYAFVFQMNAYISRLHILTEAIKKYPKACFITERCLYTDRYIFEKMLYNDKIINEIEHQVYIQWFEYFNDICKISKLIYLDTSPQICLERIKKRNRSGEENIKLGYLTELDQYHYEMIKNIAPTCDILRINNDEDNGSDIQVNMIVEFINQPKKLNIFEKILKKLGYNIDELSEGE